MRSAAWTDCKKRKCDHDVWYDDSSPKMHYSAKHHESKTNHLPSATSSRDNRFRISNSWESNADIRDDQNKVPHIRTMPYEYYRYLSEPPRRRLRFEEHWLPDNDYLSRRHDLKGYFDFSSALGHETIGYDTGRWSERKQERPEIHDLFRLSMNDRLRRSELLGLLSRESKSKPCNASKVPSGLKLTEQQHLFAAVNQKPILDPSFVDPKKTAAEKRASRDERTRPEDRWTIVPPASEESIPNNGKGQVVPVSASEDRSVLTPYQVLIRESMEYFTATKEDAETTVQGRRKTILPNQVGIRCRYCSHLPINLRMRGAVYYPRTLPAVYQVAQNIACIHFQQCTAMPVDVLENIMEERPRKVSSKCGRPYWTESCKNLGIYEDDNALWMAPPSSEH